MVFRANPAITWFPNGTRGVIQCVYARLLIQILNAAIDGEADPSVNSVRAAPQIINWFFTRYFGIVVLKNKRVTASTLRIRGKTEIYIIFGILVIK